MGRKKPVDWLRRMKRLVDSGYEEPGLMYKILQEVPPEPLPKRTQHPEKLIYPEDRLLSKFYEKFPMERLEPIELGSFDPPYPRKFVWRQMQLMRYAGLDEKAAFEQTEKEYVPGRKASLSQSKSLKSTRSTLQMVQMEEERVLLSAMREHRERMQRVE
ncbi:hypothetical protein BSKO_11412 [Bryopsis sp. KO-2023]|nr:hypothetical protein BSKO_11412 [Bryopsis sp. KO-2023]